MPVGRDAPPPSPEEAERALNRWPEDIAGLRLAWSDLKQQWHDAESRALALGDAAAGERVNDEWAFTETLRHLVFVADAWVHRTILGEARPYHRASLPPTFLPDLSALGIEATMSVGLDDAIALRRESQAATDALLGGLDDADLGRVCEPNPHPGFPPVTTHTVLRCLRTLLTEEAAHLGFATRDLTALESRSG